MMLLNELPRPERRPDQRFGDVRVQLVRAMAAEAVMRDPAAAAVDRDLATDRYVAAVDAIIAELAVLSQTGVLVRLQDLLDREVA
ncbi:hypothetical protein OEZ60_20575 [Defluviimonas sp. WL0024]|uniref:Uncharacterized protein n=1 Tax=Albidovulum salinarum TaxID=2984153 RepID=A0ABT2X9F7_9RHOB|nr:hypothetical protein [Defluviimonas sp. WL0024]MCU9850384.1 hypothetical protein [Defluviimonas sp. WL0024]